MQNSYDTKQLRSILRLPWIVTCSMFLLLLIYLVFCHIHVRGGYQVNWPEEERIMIRTLFYFFAIIGFPITNLIRHIQLRLSETIPGVNVAEKRYLYTVIVSMILIESIGVLGLILFYLGDGYNTLYIFSGLSALGLFLYRPKLSEYSRIKMALKVTNESQADR